MRLEFSDVSWAAFGITETYARRLETSALSWVSLSLGDVQYQILRAAEVTTRYVLSLVAADSVPASDFAFSRIVSVRTSSASVFDSVLLSFTAGVSELVPVPEFISFQHSFSLVDFFQPVEVVSVWFSSPFSSVLLTVDRLSLDFCLTVRDAVGYNEAFFFNGSFIVDVKNIANSVDSFSTAVASARPDVAATSEFVRVGLRHMVDFYLGGFAIGSVVFGGRVL